MAPPATVATRGISERIRQPHSGASGVSSVPSNPVSAARFAGPALTVPDVGYSQRSRPGIPADRAPGARRHLIMRRADRLFELIQLLRRARKAVTAAQLAEKLEVAPRTVYRDVAALMAMRVPVDGAAGVGYVIRPGYDLPPLMFDREEVEAIAVGLQLLGRIGDRGLLAAGRRASAKIAGVLPERREGKLDDDRFVVSDFGVPVASCMGVLRAAVRKREARGGAG